MLSMYSIRSWSEPVYMSSIKRLQIWMCLFLSFVSSVPIKRFAYEGAILVPMAVPCFFYVEFVVEFEYVVL